MAYRAAVLLVGWILRVFFRQVEVTGLENVPEEGGGLVVSWHPNALVDGALILNQFPRRIVFGARHGLFAWPLLGQILRAVGTVPVYRRQDFAGQGEEGRRAANEKSLDALAEAISDGSFSALFPEGDSHDEPAPTELRTGAARLYYRACELTPEDRPAPVIIPVGLHYNAKRLVGSRALVAFHPPMELRGGLSEPPRPDASHEERRARYRELTDELEKVLHDVVHATESWEQHHALHRARKLLRAELAHRAGVTLPRPDMKERVLAFSRLWAGYKERARTHPEEVERLTERVREYDADLKELGIDDHDLDRSPRLASPWLAVILVLQVIFVYLLLPPILVLGYVVNFPAAFVVWVVSRSQARKQKDEASLKLVTGIVAFPLTWIAVGVLVGWGKTVLQSFYPEIPGAHVVSGVIAVLLSALGAWVALNYQRLATQTFRALRVRLTRFRQKETLERLRTERSELVDAFTALAKGLDLPGRVAPDGRVLSTESH